MHNDLAILETSDNLTSDNLFRSGQRRLKELATEARFERSVLYVQRSSSLLPEMSGRPPNYYT
jgi:hypothetical protein